MELIADGLLIAGALTAALYCWVLARRLTALKSMDKGLGGAIAGLSARVEQTRASLADTKASTSDITRELSALTARAEIAAGRLELLLATLHENGHADTVRDAASPGEPAPKPEAAADTGEPPCDPGDDVVTALRRIVGEGGKS
ncbi:hypothetical protein GE300_19585 [Rhodobacteraceae bacterium 2CG4]|uniref:Uncharacterized protein n=1 Tax=Halovulum marinum TaxID=2662447 RepID=A0A6L5Z747_9RHOB|nr:hypothetical protein [Halovulum marinum]MSU91782.1 hypothetical protein [Halovulum marinum]